MAEVPSEEELMKAVFRNGKAGGESGILPKNLKPLAVKRVLCA